MRALHPGPAWLAAMCLAAQAGLHLQAQTPAPPSGDANAVMAAARDALGGEKRIATVKTVVATGRTRQVQGDNLVPIEFEIDIEVPDKYARTDEIPARESGRTTRGFNGADVIQLPPAVKPPPVAPLKQDFMRLTLGMFATSFGANPLTFSHVGMAEAPEGRADVIEVQGPANFRARLFVNNETHMPLMLSWTDAPAPTPARSSIENRLYYADYRDVDGLKLPFRIRRAIAGNTVEETVFDRFRINAKIDPRKFEIRK